MSKRKPSSKITATYVKKVAAVSEYILQNNGLRILYHHRPGTGVVTTNITYKVGARDEAVTETGLAHMLEHMMFKPTKQDIKRGIDSGAMEFERTTGSVLNANTWKDRTTYFFSYPKKHFKRALQIEAERMSDLVVSENELVPEKNNVLSEFDMVNGNPDQAIATVMLGSAFQSHPYGHETIGHREDIEDYTVAKLEDFYRRFYRPDNATLMIVGDIPEAEAIETAEKVFGRKKNPLYSINRDYAREPKQEGLRRVEVRRETNTTLLAIGFKHAGFPSQDWFTTNVLLDTLCAKEEGLLYKALVDAGQASQVEGFMEPTSDTNLGYIMIYAPLTTDLEKLEQKALGCIRSVTASTAKAQIKKSVAKILTDELFARESSLKIVAELTEYVAAGDWTQYARTEEILKGVTPQQVANAARTLFAPNNLTIGLYTNK